MGRQTVGDSRVARSFVNIEALMRYFDAGISPASPGALSTLGANPGISQASLGSLLNIAAPRVVKVVDDLEGRV
jgi:hypothetical protein